MKVQYGYEYKRCTADTLIKTGKGVLHSVVINKAATTAGVITLYDNTTETGENIIAAITVTKSDASQAPVTLIYDVRFSTGLYAGFDGTIAGADITVAYV